MCASIFCGRPGIVRALRASHPPARYIASHLYTTGRCTPRTLATSVGCSPDWMHSIARMRICSNVLWSYARASATHLVYQKCNELVYQKCNDLVIILMN